MSAYSPTYETWLAMRRRCMNPNYEGYANYGGRGITVCPSWNSFETFLADMGEKPKGMVIDRIDNEKGYFKQNCRWLSKADSNKNRRSVKLNPEKIIEICNLYATGAYTRKQIAIMLGMGKTTVDRALLT